MTKRNSRRRLGWKEFLLSLFIMVVVWAAGDVLVLDRGFEGKPEPDASGSVRVLFTHPRAQTEDTGATEIHQEFVALIDAAESSVALAAFDFELTSIASALANAADRGVEVRLVTDSDYAGEAGPRALRAAGIPVVLDDRDALMHNKFAVIDGEVVWTGSWNLTQNGTIRNNNNVVVIESAKMARNFTDEFEEMFTDGEFGATSPQDIAYPLLDLNGIKVETFFAPEGNVQQRIVDLIESADESVHFMAFVLTADDISRALLSQHRAGLRVAGVVESRAVGDPGADFETLRQGGVDIRMDANPYLLHHKVIIVDEDTVITGSYNFSASAAESNDENVVILHSPEVAVPYMEEFESVYASAGE